MKRSSSFLNQLAHRWRALASRAYQRRESPSAPPGHGDVVPTSRVRRLLRDLVKFLQLAVPLCVLPLPGFAREIYVFGDSAVDMGNYHALPGFAPGAHAPYYSGPDGYMRMSDGPMWPERLFPGLRVYSDPTRTGDRVNFAYGDAKTDRGSQEFGDELPIGVQSQVDAFASEVRAGRLKVTPSSTFFIEAGPNDFFAGLGAGTEPAVVSAQVAANLAASVEELAALGARTIFVHDIPDFGDAPAFYDLPGLTPEQGAALRRALNDAAAQGRADLRAALNASRQRLGRDVNLVTLPINQLFTAMRKNPAAFGFSNITGRIYDEENDRVLVTDPVERGSYLFVDSLHLSAAGQQWEARYYQAVIDAVEGRPQQHVARLTDAALGAASGLSRTLTRSILDSASRDAAVSGWRPFVQAAVEGRDGDSGREQPAWRADTGTFLAGATNVFADRWTAGVALGALHQRGHTEGKALRFDSGSAGVWLFGGYRADSLSVNGVLGAQQFDYRLKRDPHIPTMLARSEAEGRLAVARLEVRQRFQKRWLTTEVFGEIEAASYRLDGFAESGAPGLNLRYAETRRDGATGSIGTRSLFPGWKIGPVTLHPELWLQADYAFGDRATIVEAELIDNTANSTRGRIEHGGPWSVSSGVGLDARLGRRQHLELAVESVQGSRSLDENAVRLNYRFAF